LKEIWGTLEKEKPTEPFILGHWTKKRKLYWLKKPYFSARKKRKEFVFG
jgi:hypothetical protein